MHHYKLAQFLVASLVPLVVGLGNSNLTNSNLLTSPRVYAEENDKVLAYGDSEFFLRCFIDAPEDDKVTEAEWEGTYNGTFQKIRTWTAEHNNFRIYTNMQPYLANPPDEPLKPFWKEDEGRYVMSLQFKKSRPELSGNYKCSVDFDRAGLVSDTIKLKVLPVDVPLERSVMQNWWMKGLVLPLSAGVVLVGVVGTGYYFYKKKGAAEKPETKGGFAFFRKS